jgi:catechol 2,3-dioxygenase-like lactoylglutathione lyase family enzyme
VEVRLQHVAATFPPGQADSVRAFYGGLLGIPEMPVPPEVADQGWVWFATRDPGVELHFIPADPPPDPTRSHHFCLEVESIAMARERLAGAGAPIREAGHPIQGRARIFTRDPLGNLVELVELVDLR